MPAERLTMRKVKEVLRLHWGCGLSQRQIAKSCGVARPTVAEYLRRAEAAGLSWPLPPDLDEGQLERLLYPLPASLSGEVRPLPRWPEIHRELKRPGVTLFLLWQEYKAIRALNVTLSFQGVAAQTACWRSASRRATDT